jgi:hypothetical protein
MFKREDLAEELLLREHVRSAIQAVQKRRHKKNQLRESHEAQLRAVIRSLLAEAKKIATYDNTGKNELNIFLLNTSFLSTLETTYRKLTTSFEQRKSYIDHMVAAVDRYVQTLNSLADDGDGNLAEEEEVTISIEDDPTDDPKFMGDALEGDEEQRMEDPDADLEFGEFVIKGKDMTGAKNAYRDFKNIKDILRDAYGSLSAPEDKEAFAEELPTQVLLYGKAWENTLRPEVDVPADIEASAGGELSADAAAPELGAADELVDDEAANIELQELLQHLDIDDIIENLL